MHVDMMDTRRLEWQLRSGSQSTRQNSRRPGMRQADTGRACGHRTVFSQARVGPGFAAEAEVWEVMTLTPPGPPARGGRAGICPQISGLMFSALPLDQVP